MGAKKKPFYRIVVADQLSPRDGRFIEFVGTYDRASTRQPLTLTPSEWRIGSATAQPSDSVAQLFRRVGLLDETASSWHRNNLSPKRAKRGDHGRSRHVHRGIIGRKSLTA